MFVSEFSVWVTSSYERYKQSKAMLEKSKTDPPNDPYKSKYEAREILNQLVSEIKKKWISYGNIQVKLLSALFNYEMGLISLETEETSLGCDLLNISWEFIKDAANTPEGCHLALKILNQLAIVWSERGDYIKAIKYLIQAESIYNSYKASQDKCPYDADDMFMLDNVSKQEWTLFEKTFTHTLYYMAQVYELCDENEKSANCCRETLKRQKESEDYDRTEWALNCATLSQYYVKKKMFEEARHLLCCATDAVTKRKSELDEDNVDEVKDVWGEYHRAKASIECCAIKYSIAVLQESYQDLQSNEGRNGNLRNRDITRLNKDEDIILMEKTIPIYVNCFEEAKNLFLFAVKHVSEAKLHYTLNQYANNYVQIIQDHSSLYKCLAHYETDLSRQCKMFKRRIDMLEEVLHKLNPQYYLSVCRQLQFELGEIYFEMMDCKFKIAQSCADNLSSKVIKKINLLIMQGINNFSAFLKSLKDKEGKNPESFSDDNVRPALIAYFYLGRFHSKLIESDTNRKIYNLKKSQECYQTIVDYVERNPNHLSYIEKELPVAKEMLELMPERLAQITGSTMF